MTTDTDYLDNQFREFLLVILDESDESSDHSHPVNGALTPSTLSPRSSSSISFDQLPVQPYYRKVGGRRRSNNPTYMPELRILRRDIRRKYCDMLMNVMNSHDVALFDQFWKEFATPDFIFHATLSNDHEVRRRMKASLNKDKDAIHDREDFVKGFKLNFETTPDSVMHIKNCQIRVRQGTKGSVIVGQTSMRGTRLYAVEHPPHMNSLTDTPSFQDTGSHVQVVKSEEPSFEDSCVLSNKELLNANSFQMKKLETPMAMVMEAIFRLTLDENHHIQRFQMTFQNFHEAPAILC